MEWLYSAACLGTASSLYVLSNSFLESDLSKVDLVAVVVGVDVLAMSVKEVVNGSDHVAREVLVKYDVSVVGALNLMELILLIVSKSGEILNVIIAHHTILGCSDEADWLSDSAYRGARFVLFFDPGTCCCRSEKVYVSGIGKDLVVSFCILFIHF